MSCKDIQSNYTFKGKLVGIRELTSNWGLIDMSTGSIIIIGTNEQIQHLYDKTNELDSIPSIEILKEWCCKV